MHVELRAQLHNAFLNMFDGSITSDAIGQVPICTIYLRVRTNYSGRCLSGLAGINFSEGERGEGEGHRIGNITKPGKGS